ncbi:MAG: hypothetical protein ACKVQS_00680 [Fimbriimonadaceae bacterium]
MKIRIGLFGRVSASCEGTVLTGFPTRKAAELLMILAVHPSEPMSRKDLIALLWPGSSGGKANNRLSATLYNLRKTLEDQFGDCGAGVIGSGEGSIWMKAGSLSEFVEAQELWQTFTETTDKDSKAQLAVDFCELYRGHLGADLNGKWFEPLQSLWASRWTECVLWQVKAEVISVDSMLLKLALAQPILSVTKSLTTVFLEEIGRSDLAKSWQTEPIGSTRVSSRAVIEYKKFSSDEMPLLARRPTMTALVVESSAVSLLRQLIDQAGPLSEWVGSPQIFCARNPLFARRIATRIRQMQPLARLYLSTEVADNSMRDESRLLGWLDVVEPGETLMNSAAAALIEQHDRGVVMERTMGRTEYRLH